MKENKLDVLYHYPFRRSYYLTHPHRFFHDAYWNIRNFLHRGKYGYAYVDAWNIIDWYPLVGAAALRYMADHGSAYPGVEPWNTPKQWHDYLYNLADRLETCAKSTDICYLDELNEYAQAFHHSTDALRRHTVHEDGSASTTIEENTEWTELKEKYFARDKELNAQFEKMREETFAELGRVLPRLWD